MRASPPQKEFLSMNAKWAVLGGLGAAILAGGGLLFAQQTLQNEPHRAIGMSVTPAFEGWFTNPDGTYTLLVGYMNRNTVQELDVPIGPNNRIEPGGPDRGQPTHFLTGRKWGMFTVIIPKDTPKTQRYTWTITSNGQTNSVPFYMHTDYEISPLTEVAIGNSPPVFKFDEKGPSVQGPLAMTASRKASVATPLALTVWVSDDAKFTSGSGARGRNAEARPPVSLVWSKYRGPGTVTFDKPRPQVEKIDSGPLAFNGKATTTVTFSEPGRSEERRVGKECRL